MSGIQAGSSSRNFSVGSLISLGFAVVAVAMFGAAVYLSPQAPATGVVAASQDTPAVVAARTYDAYAASVGAPPRPASITPIPASADGAGVQLLRNGPPLQCAIYARQRTNVALSGAAITWWAQAAGKYVRSSAPEVGSILVVGGTASGHVAVVSAVISPREVRLDHANWMGQGEVLLNAPAVDVSPAGDWSQVRFWHPPTNALGLKPYPGLGFIHPNKPLQVAAR